MWYSGTGGPAACLAKESSQHYYFIFLFVGWVIINIFNITFNGIGGRLSVEDSNKLLQLGTVMRGASMMDDIECYGSFGGMGIKNTMMNSGMWY